MISIGSKYCPLIRSHRDHCYVPKLASIILATDSTCCSRIRYDRHLPAGNDSPQEIC